MQQKSNLVSGYQRARSKPAIECSIFITLLLPVSSAPTRSSGFECASRALCLTGQLLWHWSGSWHPRKRFRTRSCVSVSHLCFAEKSHEEATEGTSRMRCASGGRVARVRLGPRAQWWSSVQGLSGFSAREGAEESSVAVVSHMAL